MKYDQIVEGVLGSGRIAIYTHANMDGDAAGCSAALCLALRKTGKQAQVIIEDPVPDYLSFLAENRDIFVMEPGFAPDLSFAVDFSVQSRLSKRVDLWNLAPHSVCLDHHQNTEPIGEHSIVEPDAAACAILVYEFIRTLEERTGNALMDKDIAEAVYTGILTDTGSFRYSNTDMRALKTVSELYAYGIDSADICTRIYDNYPLAQLKLNAHAIDSMELFADGKADIAACMLSDVERYGAKPEYTETSIDALRSVAGVEVALFLKEKPDGTIKLSARSKGKASVLNISAAFGGGGHEKAAGATLTVSMDEALRLVKAEAEKELRRCGILPQA